MTADPGASGVPPRRGARGRRAATLIALVLGLGRLRHLRRRAGHPAPSARPSPRAGGSRSTSWEIAGRWQELAGRAALPGRVSYQLSATVLEDITPPESGRERIGIAPQSGCGAGVTTAAAAAVLRRDGCEAVLRATYADSTRSYVMTVGVAVLPSEAAAAKASQSLSRHG